ncbi:MAG: protein kinase [Planctomycetes bacterium]|nr:protein kinase [Planctomycetota bacterium]
MGEETKSPDPGSAATEPSTLFDFAGAPTPVVAPPRGTAPVPVPALVPETGSPSGSRRLGKFTIVSEIGAGGMGTVFRAYQDDLARHVALKTLRGAAAADGGTIERFQREARAAARLDHPGIVRVFEVGQADGTHYFTMELVEGENLLARVTRDAPPLPERVRWIRDAALAIQYAHEQGLVHRDIKPQNLLLDARGSVKVTDFGLARDASSTKALTISGEMMGTPHYTPPEQAAGRWDVVDARADVYSLAASLYHLAALVPPVEGRDIVDVVTKVLRGDVSPLRHRAPQVPRDLETIVSKAMSFDPGERYPTAREFAEDLDRFLRFEAILARPPSLWERARRGVRRHGRALGTAALVLVAVGLAGTALYWTSRRGEQLDKDEEALERRRALLGLVSRATDSEYILAHPDGVAERIRILGEVVKLDDGIAEAHLALGETYERTGRLREALDSYDRAIERDPDSIRAHARKFMLRVVWQGANAEELLPLESRWPADPYVRFARLHYETFRGKDRQVPFGELSREIEKLAPDLPEARLLLAGLHGFYWHPARGDTFRDESFHSDLSRAFREIEVLVHEDPTDVLARMNLGILGFVLGEQGIAEMHLRVAAKNAPQWAEPTYYLARSLFLAGRHAEARTELEKSIVVLREDVESVRASVSRRLEFLAFVALFQRDFEGAFEAAQDALRSGPAEPDVGIVITALAQWALGRKEDAARTLDLLGSKSGRFNDEFLKLAEKLPAPALEVASNLVRDHLIEFQDVLFLAPDEKRSTEFFLRAALALPQVKEGLAEYRDQSMVRSELEQLLADSRRLARELPEVDEGIRLLLLPRLGVTVDFDRLSSLARFFLKLVHETTLEERSDLFRARDYLWRAGLRYRASCRAELDAKDRRLAGDKEAAAAREAESRERLAAALADLEAARDLDSSDPRVHYGLATLHALGGNAALSAESLRLALQFGWSHPEWVREDPDFHAVRDSPEVRAAIGEER